MHQEQSGTVHVRVEEGEGDKGAGGEQQMEDQIQREHGGEDADEGKG